MNAQEYLKHWEQGEAALRREHSSSSLQRHGCAAGVESGDNTEPCERCNGNGWTVGRNDYEWETFQEQCEACYGTGRVEKAKPQHNAAGEPPATKTHGQH
jgi:DnaJ-class molecular chaperone